MSITAFFNQQKEKRAHNPWRSDADRLNWTLVMGTYLYSVVWLYQTGPKLTGPLLSLLLLLGVSTLFRFSNRWEYPNEGSFHLHVYIDTILAVAIALVTNSYATLPILFALTALGSGGTSKTYSLSTIALTVIGLLWLEQHNSGITNPLEVIGKTTGNLFNLFIVVGYARIINELYLQRSQLKRQKQQLSEKREELELAYDALNQSVLEREALAAEQERHRMSGELHDHMGHAMASSLIQLQYVQKVMLKDMDKAQEKLAQTYAHLNQSYEEIRQFVRESQNKQSLETGITQLCKHIEALQLNSQLEICLEIDSNLSKWQLQQGQETHLLRIIQETITNSLKHGQAKTLHINLNEKHRNECTFVQVVLKDDGLGSSDLAPGFGLGSLKRRASMIGAEIAFKTQRGEGFSTIIDIPIHYKEQEQVV